MQRRIAFALLAGSAALAAGPREAAAQRIAQIQMAPQQLRMAQDAVTLVAATAYDVNGTPIDVSFRWSSSNINIASVDARGNVRANQPGIAVITATTDDNGRQRMGRMTVAVMGTRTGPPPNSMNPPVRQPPPDARRIYTAPDMAHMDSAMAAIDCNEPMLNTINPMRACWDRRAMSRDSVIQVPERPGPDVCPRGVTAVGLLLLVSDSGTVTDVRPYTESNCGVFTLRVIDMARHLTFTPAQKAGKPVRAWVRLQIRGQPVDRAPAQPQP